MSPAFGTRPVSVCARNGGDTINAIVIDKPMAMIHRCDFERIDWFVINPMACSFGVQARIGKSVQVP